MCYSLDALPAFLIYLWVDFIWLFIILLGSPSVPEGSYCTRKLSVLQRFVSQALKVAKDTGHIVAVHFSPRHLAVFPSASWRSAVVLQEELTGRLVGDSRSKSGWSPCPSQDNMETDRTENQARRLPHKAHLDRPISEE